MALPCFIFMFGSSHTMSVCFVATEMNKIAKPIIACHYYYPLPLLMFDVLIQLCVCYQHRHGSETNGRQFKWKFRSVKTQIEMKCDWTFWMAWSPLRHWFSLKLRCDNNNYDIVVINDEIYMFPRSYFVFQGFMELVDHIVLAGCSTLIFFIAKA